MRSLRMAAGWTAGLAAAPLLTVAAFLVGPIGFLAPLGLAPLLTVAALGLAAIAVRERRLPAPPLDLSIALTLLCVIALASVTWAVDPDQSLARALRLIAECVEGVLLLDAVDRLEAAERRRVLIGLALGLGVTALLGFVDAALGRGLMRWIHGAEAPPTVGNRGDTVLALMMWPALVGLARRRGGAWVASAAWAVAALAIALGLAASAHLALAVASIVFAAAWWRGRGLARVAFVLAPALVLAMPVVPLVTPPERPLLPLTLLKPSAIHRLVIWQYTDQRIAEKPLLGWGMDAARAMPGHDVYRSLPDATGTERRYELMPLHPHNGALQVWVEL
ncbi:MAG: O-antigen ligase family protein, partial [Alphaproteobacteria bacterium]|nr:O-antigen ligase family protein [Alphaproteobacteria bacterium]